MDLSEVLLFLDLKKKDKKNPVLDELKMLLYFLDNYDEVTEFYIKLQEHRPPFKFYVYSLIHFIEDYEVCVEIKKMIFQNTKRKYQNLFIHLILLSESEEQAISTINEAKKYDINLNEEVWAHRYNSMGQIKNDQEIWKKDLGNSQYNRFSEIYEEFLKMKSKYFNSLTLNQLKQTIAEKQPNETTPTITQAVVYNRSVYIKEFARRVAVGICQLCDKEAPFLDKRGNPFLEVHHINDLSKGGSDSIDNVVALCPNCHRKIHQLELEDDFVKLEQRASKNMKYIYEKVMNDDNTCT